ncbi:NAD-specific glutamate dehydrogenase [compost metagenome]
MHLDQWQGVFQHRDIKGTAAQIEDQRALKLLFMQAVGHGCGCRLVDQALHVQAGELGGEAGALALLVAEIRWHRDNRLAHRAAEKGFGIGFQGTEHQCREFLRAE